MRTMTMLKELDDVLILYQYLYMNPDNRITINNRMNDFEIRLDDELRFYCKNMTYPDLPDMSYSEHMTLKYCLSVIRRLKEQAPKQFPETFNSLWDEIKDITMAHMALNFCE